MQPSSDLGWHSLLKEVSEFIDQRVKSALEDKREDNDVAGEVALSCLQECVAVILKDLSVEEKAFVMAYENPRPRPEYWRKFTADMESLFDRLESEETKAREFMLQIKN